MSITRRTFSNTAIVAATLACTPAITAGALLSPRDLLYCGYADRLRFWHLYRVHLPANPVPRDVAEELIARAVRLKELTPDGLEIVETCARLDGCKPTDFAVQQINLIIGQAELMGEL
jgi:hypothetical protein